MDDDAISIEALTAIVEMEDVLGGRWHSIRLARLKEICKLAMANLYEQERRKLATSHLKAAYSQKKGVDFPCALFPGPAGDCNESNCKCR